MAWRQFRCITYLCMHVCGCFQLDYPKQVRSHRRFEYTQRTFPPLPVFVKAFFHSAYILRSSVVYNSGGNVCPSAVKLLRPSGWLLCSASREQLISHSIVRVSTLTFTHGWFRRRLILTGLTQVVITTESKSVSLEWRRFETFLQEVVFSHQITLEDSMDGFLGILS
jgi:hypothetical protein